MATKYGTNKTIERAGTSVTDAGLLGGRVRCMVGEYTCDGVADLLLATADVVQLGKELPVGARVLDVVLASEGVGGDVQVSIGDAVDASRYIGAASIVATELTRMLDAEGGSVGYEIISTTRQILATVAAGTSNTDAAKFKVIIYYTHD